MVFRLKQQWCFIYYLGVKIRFTLKVVVLGLKNGASVLCGQKIDFGQILEIEPETACLHLKMLFGKWCVGRNMLFGWMRCFGGKMMFRSEEMGIWSKKLCLGRKWQLG